MSTQMSGLPMGGRISSSGVSHVLGRPLFDSIVFEMLNFLTNYLSYRAKSTGKLTPLEQHLAGQWPGAESKMKAVLAQSIAPYSWISDPKLREKKQKELEYSHQLTSTDILDLFFV